MSEKYDENWYKTEGWRDVTENDYNPFLNQPIRYTKPYDIKNPVSIHNYLKKIIYKQEDYIKNLSLFLYNHVSGRPSVMLVSGPPGNGKTYAAEQLKKIYSATIIWDSSTFTKDGWNGSNKIQDLLKECTKHRDPIIVLDEFDKLCQPQFSHNANTSLAMQSEFLKLFEGNNVLVKSDTGSHTICTKHYSWLLLGSFSHKADEIAENNSQSGLGFASEKNDYKPYSKSLTLKDITDYGMIKEIASRITKICHTESLSYDDYYHLLTEHNSSPIKEIEEKYNFSLNLSEKELCSLCKECYENGLGIRSLTHKLTNIADEKLYNQFLNHSASLSVNN